MSKMIIMQGLPASGKSTRAAELIKEMGNAVRINKDLLRTMLHFDKFTGVNESHTRDAARKLADWFLLNDMNVIIDDTNLNPGTLESWKALAKIVNAKMQIEKMETPVEECVSRDATREKRVGKSVIRGMAMQYGLAGDPGIGYILCDIDGTLADLSHRRHFVADVAKKDWKSFFEAMSGDIVREDTKKSVEDYQKQGYKIILVTARPEDYRKQTEEWLERHDVEYYVLLMRRSGDKRQDTDVKQDMLERYFPNASLIKAVFDDRPSVIRMWQSNGLNVIDVGDGVEF